MKRQVPVLPALPALAACALAALAALAGCGGSSTPTTVTYERVDRAALPALNAGLIPSATQMASYNQGAPTTDAVSWDSTAYAQLAALRSRYNGLLDPPDSPGITDTALVASVLPDVITLDLGRPTAYPNGRGLQDDVMDIDLGRILNRGSALSGGPGVPDGITAASKSKQFLTVFPYLATPNMGGP